MPNQVHRKFNKKTIFYSLSVIGLLLLIGWSSRALWLPWMFLFLDVSEAPHSADFIVVLGTSTKRTQKAIDLYNQGFAPRIILCGCGESLSSELERLDTAVSEDDILIRQVGDSTWEEAIQVLELLRENNAHSALIITSAFHTRRAQAVYRQLQADSPVELTFIKATDQFDAENWWQNRHMKNSVLKEFLKLPYYLLRYGVWPF